MNRSIIWSLLGLVLLAGMLAVPAPARARSLVVFSTPADGAVLQTAPQTLQLWFDTAAIIEPGAVTLSDADGAEVALHGFHNEIYKPDDAGLEGLFDPTFLFLCSVGLNSYPTTLMVHLPTLGPGTYRLSWRAIAIFDKQVSSGSLVFAVDPTAPLAAEAGDRLAQSYTSLADDLMVTMAVRPNRPGANFISLQAAPVRRPIRAPITALSLVLTPPNGAPRMVPVSMTADGRFQAAGDLIDRPGRWSAEVRIDRGIASDTLTRISWDVPAASRGLPLWGAGGALAGLALILGLRRRSGRAGGLRRKAPAASAALRRRIPDSDPALATPLED